MGGVYKPANIAVYTYAHQNPIKIIDPDGNASMELRITVGFGFGDNIGGSFTLGRASATDPNTQHSEKGWTFTASGGGDTSTGFSLGVSMSYNPEATSINAEPGKSSIEGTAVAASGSIPLGAGVNLDTALEVPLEPISKDDKFMTLGISIGNPFSLNKSKAKPGVSTQVEHTIPISDIIEGKMTNTSGEIYISP